jgi:hypothetical protein
MNFNITDKKSISKYLHLHKIFQLYKKLLGNNYIWNWGNSAKNYFILNPLLLKNSQ